ncbi:hypothetical protein C0J52_18426 [Blattella germanica]|nr:hypothetical protein C0J52_18426 [Blattella germanica]
MLSVSTLLKAVTPSVLHLTYWNGCSSQFFGVASFAYKNRGVSSKLCSDAQVAMYYCLFCLILFVCFSLKGK